VGDERWWSGFDAVVLGALTSGERVLDIGCGDGGLVDRLVAGGLDAVGVDPRAPRHPRIIRTAVEEVGAIGPFDAVCAVMTLHHVHLDAVLGTIVGLLRPGGRLFVDELSWEAYDRRAASWLGERDRSARDHSVTAWEVEHGDLHTGVALHAKLSEALDLQSETQRPYLARMLGMRGLEHGEQSLIDEGALPALGRWYVASV
jgi:SAM-dependent methyltransferase